MAQLPPDRLAKRENPSSETPEVVAAPTQIAIPAQPVSVPIGALLSGQRWRLTARWVGLGMFLFGSLLLAYVFWQALTGFQNFTQPDYFSLRFNRVDADNIPDKVQGIVAVFGAEFLRVLYLLLLGFIASAIASKGIQFFAASEAVIDEAVAAGLDA